MADREHIVRYVAVLDTSGFWKEFQAHKEKLEKENKSAAKSTDKLTQAIDNQVESLDDLNDEMDDTEEKTGNINNAMRKNVASAKVLISALSEYRTGLRKGNKELLKSVTGLEDYSDNVEIASSELKSFTAALENNKDSLDPDVYRKLSKEMLSLGKDLEAITGKVGFADAKSRNQSILAEAVKFHTDRLKAEEDAQKELLQAEEDAHKEKESREKEAFARLIEDAKQMNRIFNQNIKNELERRTAIEKQGYADSVDNFDDYLKTFKNKAKGFGSGGFFSVGDLSSSKKELQEFKKEVISFKDEFSRGDFKRITTSIESIETSFNKVGSARHDVDEVSSSVRNLDVDVNRHSSTMSRIQESYSRFGKGVRAIAGSFYQIKAGFLGLGAVGIAFALQSIVSALAALGGAAVVAVQSLSQLAGVAASIPGALFAIGAAAGALKFAFDGIGDAFKLFGKENGLEAPKTFAEALSRLHPAAKSVVQDLTGMNDKFQDMKKATQGAFFKPIEGSVKSLSGLFPVFTGILTKAAGALGRVAKSGIEMVTSGPWKSSFKSLGDSSARVISSMGKGLLTLADAFRKIAVAAMPLTEFLGRTFSSLAKDFSGWTDTLNSGSFDVVQTRVKQFIGIIKNFGSIFASIFRAASDTTDWFMNRFVAATSRWKNALKSASASGGGLTNFFKELKPVLTEVSKLFSDLFKGLAKRVELPQLANVVSQLRTELLPALFAVFDAFSKPENITAFITAIAEIGELLAGALDAGLVGAITHTLELLGMLGQAVLWVINLPVVDKFVGFGASIVSWGIALGIASAVLVKMGSTLVRVGAVLTKVTGIFRLFGAAATIGTTFGAGLDNAGKSLGATGDAASQATKKVGRFSTAVAAMGGPFGIATAAISALAIALYPLTSSADDLNLDVNSVDKWTSSIKKASVEARKLDTSLTVTTEFADGGDITESFVDLESQINRLNRSWAGAFGEWFGGSGHTADKVTQNVEHLDDALSDLVTSGDALGASSGLQAYIDTASKGGETAKQLELRFPKVVEALRLTGQEGTAAAQSLLQVADSQRIMNGLFSEWDAQSRAEKFREEAKAIKERGKAFNDDSAAGKANLAVVQERARSAQDQLARDSVDPSVGTAAAAQNYHEQMTALLALIPATDKNVRLRNQLNAAMSKVIPPLKISVLTAPLQDAVKKAGSLDGALTKLADGGKFGRLKSYLTEVGQNVPTDKFKSWLATVPGLQSSLSSLGLRINETSGIIEKIPDANIEVNAEVTDAQNNLEGVKLTSDEVENQDVAVEATDETNPAKEGLETVFDLQNKVGSNTTTISVDSTSVWNAIGAMDILNGKVSNTSGASKSSGGGSAPAGPALPNKGGRIGSSKVPFLRRNRGGGVPGTGDEDKVPALLTPGEFVLPRKVVAAIGAERLEKLRTAGARAGDVIQRFAKGGAVGKAFKAGKDKSSNPAAFASGFMKSLKEKLAELRYNNKSEEGKRASDGNKAGIESAKRLTEAQREQARAIYSNMIAQRDAARATEDLTKAAARRGTEEADAALSLKEAIANQRKVNRDASSTKLDRERAALAVTRAQYGVEDTATDSVRIREDLASLPEQQQYDQEDRSLEMQTLQTEINNLRQSSDPKEIAKVNSQIKKEIAKEKAKKKRALGGSVGSGVPYLTSEVGEELFIPANRGRVLTSNDTQKLMSMINLVPSMPNSVMNASQSAKIEATGTSSSSGGNIQISNLNINNPVPERASDSIQKTLKKITTRQV